MLLSSAVKIFRSIAIIPHQKKNPTPEVLFSLSYLPHSLIHRKLYRRIVIPRLCEPLLSLLPVAPLARDNLRRNLTYSLSANGKVTVEFAHVNVADYAGYRRRPGVLPCVVRSYPRFTGKPRTPYRVPRIPYSTPVNLVREPVFRAV